MRKPSVLPSDHRGFTLLEMLIVVAVLGVILGGIMVQLANVVQRESTEQVKVDDFQEARDFVDQFFRDINQIGYPNIRLVDPSSPSFVPAINLTFPPAAPNITYDNRFAAGLVKIDANEIWFEGDTNGDGIPESIHYMINGSGTCAQCLQRSQVNKANASPLAQAANWGTEVNDVISNPSFFFFRTDGTQVLALPADINGAPATLANIKTIQIKLTIQNPNVMDPKTKQPIQTTFEGEVSLNNCSMAASGQTMSCM
jgi:prepilin-type N-terminal cleavage/methylation domain-containing protein